MPAGFFPIFLPSRLGANYAFYIPAAVSAETPPLGTILWLQPFAEEANCARRHLVAAARECQQHGIGSLILDLSGCGESDGDLAGTSLRDWLDEIQHALEWLDQRTAGPVWLGGLRAGALLATHVAALRKVSGVVLWQPVLSGRSVIDQFLRQQLAVDWAQGSAANAAQILAGLRETLARGEAITVAGYTLSAGLAADLAAMEVSAEALARTRIVLLESRSAGTAASGLSPGLEKFCTSLQAAGAEVLTGSCEATPFWAAHEAPLTPAVAHVLASTLLRAMPVIDNAVQAEPAADLCRSSPSDAHLLVLPVAEGVTATLHDGCHDGADASSGMGVIMLTGGMQIRAGSHRQYLSLARTLAAEGHAVLRLDFPGFGDSPGTPRHYADNADVIAAAIAELQSRKLGLRGFVLWGLCDGASAAALHACADERVMSVLMVNPWLDDIGEHVGLSGYYHRRLTTPQFWCSLLRGEVGVMSGVAGFVRHLWHRLFASVEEGGQTTAAQNSSESDASVRDIWSALEGLSGRVTVVTGDADRTGQAFLAMLARRPEVQKGVVQLSVSHADHTFSTPQWHAALVEHTRVTMAREAQRAGDAK
ncbi:MAG: hypothetical protein JWN23_3167 [Rhodocyclales bacterium]|nr:hypothetical protein [Rhodocyclales bacterium]